MSAKGASKSHSFTRDRIAVRERDRHARFRVRQRPLVPETRAASMTEPPRSPLPRQTVADVFALRTIQRALSRVRTFAVMQREIDRTKGDTR